MTEQSYQRLAQHLDRLPGGFAATATGAELRLLATLFTPAEADLAVHLTLDREDTTAISARAGIPVDEAAPRLEAMARKGLIFAVYAERGPTLYQAAPWVVGIYEFQVKNSDPRFWQATFEYRRAQTGRPAQPNRQLRTIPVGRSVEVRLEVLPYEQVDALVGAQDRFAVTSCLCRHVATLQGAGCDAPMEACLVFGEWADYYVRNGMARAIDRAEVAGIIALADEANLVLQPSNSRDISFLCCCCSCCCGVLSKLRAQPRPAEAVTNAFIAEHDPEACLACGDCLDRCPMQALTDAGDRVHYNAERCIGCGLCVKTCANGAMRLVRKPAPARLTVHANVDALWHAESSL